MSTTRAAISDLFTLASSYAVCLIRTQGVAHNVQPDSVKYSNLSISEAGVISDERKISLRRKAQIDTGALAPDNQEEADFWLYEVQKQVAYLFGGLAGCAPAFHRDERIDAANLLNEMNREDPTTPPVLSIVKTVAGAVVIGTCSALVGASSLLELVCG